jgi:hypothetical protein
LRLRAKENPGGYGQAQSASDGRPPHGQVAGKSRDQILASPGSPASMIQERADQNQQDQERRHRQKKPAQHPRQPTIAKACEHPSPFSRHANVGALTPGADATRLAIIMRAHCKLQIANFQLQICILQFAFCNSTKSRHQELTLGIIERKRGSGGVVAWLAWLVQT